ncbi:methyl-accepting chemotaxis protein [Anoxybacillus flavithermus]|uniref:Methyl-accepting chemotaxis protein n=1 Tax=Anoxybacillus flavithermus AK1 TaxID=1297581 RepID=M8DZT9_9BACL|nr:methyl-accepting chemotaxis protein [Anoxybacillus flavithermus AK1]
MLFKRLRPAVSELLEKGTDYSFHGRFVDTLSYNHFTTEDFAKLKQIDELIAPHKQEMIRLFYEGLQHVQPEAAKTVTEARIEAYVNAFFTMERNRAYVDESLRFFHLLRKEKVNVGKLIVAFNQFNFFVLTTLLAKVALAPKRCLALMEALQRAINIEQQLLVEVYTETMMEQIASGTAELMEQNAEIMFIKDLLQALDQQNSDVQMVTAATEEMTTAVSEVAHAATVIAEKTTTSVERAEKGQHMMNEAFEEIMETSEQFTRMVDRFEHLQQHLSAIEKVMQLVNGIADQTNLLALNASIEAARAGEYGKGFSVVAEEIRKLADHTVQSLGEVQRNVGELRTISSEVSSAIYSTSATIRQAVNQAQEAMPLLQDIVHAMGDIQDSTNTNAAVAEEQAAAVDEISSRMSSIASLTEYVRELGEKTGKTVHALSKAIDRFRLSMVNENSVKLSAKALLHLAKTDHLLWKWRIYNMIVGYETVRPEDVASHYQCRLGKWYFDEQTKKQLAGTPAYERLNAPHERVHVAAKKAAEAYAKGDRKGAEAQLIELEQASAEVIRLIDELMEKVEKERTFETHLA